MLRFAHLFWLLALLLPPLYWLWQTRWQHSQKLKLPFTRVELLRQIAGENRFWKYFFPVLRLLVLLFLILALAQPRWGKGTRDINKSGVDIVLAIDVSGSMLALDFLPKNRLEAAADVALDFISKRPNDRFGLVAFSEFAVTQSPLTFDHQAVREQLQQISVNLEASGTAIGLGLAKAVARLKDSQAQSKVVILITDGVNNTGEIDPETAAKMAQAYDIRVYPIGVGSDGLVRYPTRDPFDRSSYGLAFVELDMETLHHVAEITGTGEAAKVGNSQQLKNIMDQIDEMETTKMDATLRYVWAEQFMPLLWAAFAMLLLELLVRLIVMPILPE